MGSEGLSIFVADLGFKMIFPKRLRATTRPMELFWEDRFNRARNHPLLLYEVEKRQGWLVTELNVLLHMAHAWASRQPDLKADILGKLTFAKASGDRGEAAGNAVTMAESTQLTD